VAEAETTASSLAGGGAERTASTLELFFDLVYVFAITQVVAFVHHEPTAVGLLKAGLLLLIMWWTWSLYTWTTNWTGTASTAIKLFLLATMGGSLVMATAVRGAFAETAPLFGASVFVVRVLAAGLYYVGSRDYPAQRAAFMSFFPVSLLAACLFLVGGFLPPPWLLVLFLGGVGADVVSAASAGKTPWEMDASHFAERNGLFVIIALGESVVGVGLTAAGVALDLAHVVAMVVAFLGISGLWWVYFTGAAPYAVAHLTRLSGVQRSRFARDAYSFLHYPLVVGIVSFAVGMEDLVAHPDQPLPLVGRVAVAFGMSLVLLAITAGKYRAVRCVAWEKLAAAALLVAWTFVAASVSALGFAGAALVVLLAVLLVGPRVARSAPVAAN
jgi:low temperature requirement protein LtrA